MQAKCGVYSSLGTKHCTISGSGLLCCHEEKSYSNRKKAGKYQKSKYNVDTQRQFQTLIQVAQHFWKTIYTYASSLNKWDSKILVLLRNNLKQQNYKL